MLSKIPNPPKFNKKILFNFRLFMISISDLVIFVVLSILFLPLIIFINNWISQISLSVTYLFLIILSLIRLDGVWLRDYFLIIIKYFFSKKNYLEKQARSLTNLGILNNGFFKSDNNYSKYYEIIGSDISLTRETELAIKIEALNLFFNFGTDVKFTLASVDKPLNVDDFLNQTLNLKGNDPIYNLLKWNKYHQFANVESKNTTKKIYILKITSIKKENINNAFNLAKIRLSKGNFNIHELINSDIILYQSKIFYKKISEKSFTEKSADIFTNIKKISFYPSDYKITFSKKINGENKLINHYFRILVVTQNPKYSDLMWLNSIFNIQDLSVFSILETNSSKDGKNYINTTSRVLKFKFENIRENIIDETETIKFYEQIKDTADWITSGNSALLDSKMLMLIDASSRKQLRKKVSRAKILTKNEKIKLNSLLFEQQDAFKILTEA